MDFQVKEVKPNARKLHTLLGISKDRATGLEVLAALSMRKFDGVKLLEFVTSDLKSANELAYICLLIGSIAKIKNM